ncbi:MAG: thioredoxin domain-containing protein [Alphaproteobacteria bacterium]|nr:thioredoxin domain-containing protein [Alphaproteobacteria bacterium]
MALVKDVNVNELELALKGDKPVLIDFWATWCRPCTNLMPIVEDVAARYGDQILVVKMNIADYPDIAGAMEVVSVPNLQCFKDGKKLGEKVGFMTQQEIEEWLKDCGVIKL